MNTVEHPTEAPRRGPGRPASDAPQRILDAAYRVLKDDGYAGLTTAKVASASGQNKALISYYYGSKQGLVAAVARHVSEELTDQILGQLGSPNTVGELVHRLVNGMFDAMDRDDGLNRVYFDLASQSVVEPKVGVIMMEMKEGHRAIVRQLLQGLDDAPIQADLDAAATFLIAGFEGLALERIERGATETLSRAQEMFVEAATAVIAR